MIETLRRRFIGVTMLSVFLVLLILISAINLANFHSTNERADAMLGEIAASGGVLPKDPPGEQKHDGPRSEQQQREMKKGIEKKKAQKKHHVFDPPGESSESRFEARYFTVYLDGNKQVAGLYTEKIHAVTNAEAKKMAVKLVASGKTSGYIDHFRYLVTPNMVICLERYRDLSSFYSFLVISYSLSALALLLVFLLVLLFSRRAVAPVAESYDKQKEFITNAGHELKTPLAIIQSCTGVIEMENGETKWTNGIHEQVDRLSTMTADLVSLSRMDESSMKLEKVPLDFSEIAEKTLRPFAMVAEEKGKPMEIQIQPGITVHGNERTLKQLCSILADNAIKYATPGTKIKITLSKHGKRAYLISDNQAENVKKGSHRELFNRFYRGDTSHSSKTSGYGIGLSMAQSIVRGHEGDITAESPDGKRLVISASIPV